MKFCPRKCISLKHILALPTWGLTCTDFEEKPFEVANFDLGHPVPSWFDEIFSAILKWDFIEFKFNLKVDLTEFFNNMEETLTVQGLSSLAVFICQLGS